MKFKDADILRLARAYGEARLAYRRALERPLSRKLDEFHPRRVAWENRVWHAEHDLDAACCTLLDAITVWVKTT